MNIKDTVSSNISPKDSISDTNNMNDTTNANIDVDNANIDVDNANDVNNTNDTDKLNDIGDANDSNITSDTCNKNDAENTDNKNDAFSIEDMGAPIKKQPRYVNLVLSGGSVKGISHLGALQRLQDLGEIDFDKMKSIAGTSAGGLIGMLLTLKFSVQEIWEFVYCLNMKNMVNPNLMTFLQKCGFDTGQIIFDLIEDILDKKTGIKHINFRQLHEISGIHYIVVGSNLTTKKIVYFDHINTPLFKVSVAVRISTSIPFFFVPVTVGQHRYIDGGVLNDYPMNLFEDRLDETIGIRICNQFNTQYSCLEEYPFAILNLFLHKYYNVPAEAYSTNTIKVLSNDKPDTSFNFDIDNLTKESYYQQGIEAAENFINDRDHNH